MSTEVKIDRLVLEGLELSRRERETLAPSIARELRLLGSGRASRDAPEWHRRFPSAVDRIAHEVAVAVRGAIGPGEPRGRR